MLRGSAAATNARILAKHSVDVTQLNGHVFGTPDVEPAATATTNGAQRTRSRSRRRRAPPSVLVGASPSPAPASWCSPSSHVCRTLAISCEAVPASIMVRRGHEPAPPTGHGAGESFVSFIALFGARRLTSATWPSLASDRAPALSQRTSRLPAFHRTRDVETSHGVASGARERRRRSRSIRNRRRMTSGIDRVLPLESARSRPANRCTLMDRIDLRTALTTGCRPAPRRVGIPNEQGPRADSESPPARPAARTRDQRRPSATIRGSEHRPWLAAPSSERDASSIPHSRKSAEHWR